jgi:hypothetical protein
MDIQYQGDQSVFDPQLAEGVGRLCAAWAFLEVVVATKVWQMIGLTEPMGRLVTDNLDLRRRWQLLIDVAELTGVVHLHQLYKSKTNALTDLTRDRNLIVHGAVTLNPGDKTFCWQIDRGAYAGRRIPAKAKTVIATKDAVNTFANEVFPELIRGA